MLEFLGREDRQVKVRGFRIELQEIESVLAQRFDVRAVAVLARPGENGAVALAAYLVPQDRASFSLDGVMDYARARLPSYMIPTFAALIDLMPLSLNGKVDEEALAEVPVRPVTADMGYRPPQSALEQELADILQELLGCERIGLDNNFFEMGGHSLLAVQWLARIHARFGLEWPLHAFFKAPTVDGAARWISEHAVSRSGGNVEDLSDEDVDTLLRQLLAERREQT